MSTSNTKSEAPVYRPQEARTAPYAICFHAGDEVAPTEGLAVPYSICFHAGDEVTLSGGRDEPLSFCFHPGDDLAADLHLALTGIDEQQLAVLATSRS